MRCLGCVPRLGFSWSCRAAPSGGPHTILKVFLKVWSQGGVLEGKFDGRNEKPQFVPGVVSLALYLQRKHWRFLRQFPEGVGQLDLAVFPWLGLSEDGENLRRQDVATDDREIRGGFGRRGFFNQAFDPVQSCRDPSRRDDPIAVDFLVGDFLHPEDCPVAFFVGMNELCEAGHRGIDDFVAQNDGKGLVPDQSLGAEDGMAQPQRFRLTDVAKVGERGDVSHLAQELCFAAALEIFFQFDGAVEVIFDCAFAPSCDDDNVFDPGGDRFFYRILNQRLVDERQHFFGRSFRRRKEASAKACGWNHGFADFEA